MLSERLDQIINNDRLHLTLVLLISGLAVYLEVRSWHIVLRPAFSRIAVLGSNAASTINDYRSGRYYKPWAPKTPTVIVSSKKHMLELSESACLSQRAVYADMFGFKHTMNNFEHNTNDHRLIRTRLYGRLLQVNGPIHLNRLYPLLDHWLGEGLRQELQSERKLRAGISLPTARTSRRLASKLMAIVFFGERLASDQDFSEALLQYPQDMVKCMAAFQVTPAFLSPLVHAILTKRGRAMHLIQARLLECMGPGRASWEEAGDTESLSIMHNMTDLAEGSDYWTPELLSQSLLGIWFAASHQPWMNLNFIILELCSRTEWQDSLRSELQQHMPLDYQRLEQLPLLDGFIKETVRLNPLDTLAVRRKALRPYTFSDASIHAPGGATVCVSAHDLMHDPRTYSSPYSFDPTRFRSEKGQQRFTEVSESFPVWGFGSLACPGRFHAGLVIKMVLSHLLLGYELRLENDKARTRWSWETFTLPYESTRVVLTPRD
ncbi:putative cytochrome P450 [Xylariaceae sp. FL0804]|nr:putative cytochrome P450 [Xylariaceae sp. FL0804]